MNQSLTASVLPPPRSRHRELLPYTLLLALAIHGLVILGLAFVPEPPKPHPRQDLVRITLVRPARKPPRRVEKPDLLAQANREGGGAPKARPARAQPIPQGPASPSPARTVASPPERAAHLHKITPKVVESRAARGKAAPARPTPHRPRVDAAHILRSVDLEIAELSQEIERKAHAYARRPRRKAINASTREYKYAAYLEAWRRKVERIGNLNYPDEARRRKLHGNLLLHVAVRADGSIERIHVIRSSGHQVLDDAAVRIVRLAAPFAPFPPAIRKETDVLDITRTWQFLSNNRLR